MTVYWWVRIRKKEIWSKCCSFWRWGKEPRTKESWQLPEVEKGNELDSTVMPPNKLDFRTFSFCGCKRINLCCFRLKKIVLICYNSKWKEVIKKPWPPVDLWARPRQLELLTLSSGLLWWVSGKESARQCRRCRLWSPAREDPLEKEMATHSSIFVWKIQWTEEPGGLHSTGSQRVGHSSSSSTIPHPCGLFAFPSSGNCCKEITLNWKYEVELIWTLHVTEPRAGTESASLAATHENLHSQVPLLINLPPSSLTRSALFSLASLCLGARFQIIFGKPQRRLQSNTTKGN